MARHFTKPIKVCFRSGLINEAAKKTVINRAAHGPQIIETSGDAADIEFIRRVFKHASPETAGVIQRAMVLKVSFQFSEI